MDKLVSIIMPVYNAAPYVGQAIQSVLDQTYSEWELLIVDDGSTDGSSDVIHGFDDKRIFTCHQQNKGVSAARNAGLRKMRGDYFCFLDADDVLPKRSIEARLHLFDDGISFVDGVVDVFDDKMLQHIRRWMPSHRGPVLNRLFRLDSACFFGLTWMVRRNTTTLYQFDESLTHCEDLLFYMSIAGSGTYTFTSEPILGYRRSAASAMANVYGLGRGYARLRMIIRDVFRNEVSFYDKLIFEYKIRRIMFLSLLRVSQRRAALRFLMSAKVDL